jgi:C1A family cysteine protease
MAEKKGVLLSGIAGFPQDAAEKLSSLWITTAEELVSAAVREGGPEGLAGFLSMTADQVTQMVDLAQAALPPGVAFGAGDIPSFGLGAMDEPSESDSQSSAMLSFAPLPAKIDLHDKMSPIRNQGQRGTCVSFATTAVREYLLKTNGSSSDLSEQFLYWDCKKHDGLPGGGTYINVAMDRLLADGECPESAWPYNPSPVPGNESQDPPPSGASSQASSYRITATTKLPARSPDDLRQALANGSPIAFAVPVYTYWFGDPVLTTGDIRLPLPSDHLEGGHAMCMVGYEDDPSVPGGGYFMVRNSWGTDWACNGSVAPGYARLPYAYMQQYASAAQTASATPLPAPTPKAPDDFFTRLSKWLKGLFG